MMESRLKISEPYSDTYRQEGFQSPVQTINRRKQNLKKKLELVSEFSILYIIQTIESLGINLTKVCKICIPKTIKYC